MGATAAANSRPGPGSSGAGKRILVLASAADEVALGLPERLSRPDLLIVTPRDLSRSGWCYRPGESDSTLAVGGETIASERIAGVITRLPWITGAELAHIVPGDRAYVATEMVAFLVGWLSELACPVVNRPSPDYLCGPFWRRERWVAEAAVAGLAVEPVRRVLSRDVEHPEPSPGKPVGLTVVGERCLGEADPRLAEQALALARATGVETLRVAFSHAGPDARFLTASPHPFLEDDAVAQALLDLFVPEPLPTPAGR